MNKSILTRLRNSLKAGSGPVVDPDSAAPSEPATQSKATPPPETKPQDPKPAPVPVVARKTRNQRDGKTFFKWSRRRSPTSQSMMVPDLKLVYQPIAKNACSSTKRMVASLGGFEVQKGQGIHHSLDTQNTGLQFKDRTEAEVTAALNDPGWMRFVIYRDPLDRLVSAYVEKFVQNRRHPNQWKTIDGVMKAIFEKDDLAENDYEHGITFREFAEYILAENPDHLNSHWQPQTYYLGHIPFTHMYDVKALDRLEHDLRAHVGEDIELPRMNVSRDEKAEPEYLPMAPDLLPRDLSNAKRLSTRSFLDGDLHSKLSEYYAADITIYRLIKANHGALLYQS